MVQLDDDYPIIVECNMHCLRDLLLQARSSSTMPQITGHCYLKCFCCGCDWCIYDKICVNKVFHIWVLKKKMTLYSNK